MRDTTPAFERTFTAMVMSRSGEERLLMGADMFDSAVQMMRAGIAASREIADEVEMRERLLERLYGEELSARARRTIARRIGRVDDRRRSENHPADGSEAANGGLR